LHKERGGRRGEEERLRGEREQEEGGGERGGERREQGREERGGQRREGGGCSHLHTEVTGAESETAPETLDWEACKG
jgi:hypothetical protein